MPLVPSWTSHRLSDVVCRFYPSAFPLNPKRTVVCDSHFQEPSLHLTVLCPCPLLSCCPCCSFFSVLHVFTQTYCGSALIYTEQCFPCAFLCVCLLNVLFLYSHEVERTSLVCGQWLFLVSPMSQKKTKLPSFFELAPSPALTVRECLHVCSICMKSTRTVMLLTLYLLT